MKRLKFLELNEVNFDLVSLYLSKFPGKFPGFEKLVGGAGILTSSETEYENLEPWIQWVSIRSGKSYDGHKIFRLGDIVGSKIPQIYEQLESRGFTVGGISPINAENRLKNPAYFIPDPWTKTVPSNSWWSKRLHASISQAVNDNAQSRISKLSALYILMGLIRFAKFKHYYLYLRLIFKSAKYPWCKALLLDLFLHDVHSSFFANKHPNYSTLFLNAGAHIQHHYLLNSPFLSSEIVVANPRWYISPTLDPFAEMLAVYDCIIGESIASNESEYLIATGLSQRPYDRIKYYYRLKDHRSFLKKIGINFLGVFPRMTRDFLIMFRSDYEAKLAQDALASLRIDGVSEAIFGMIENRGDELFVSLTYPFEVKNDDLIVLEDQNKLNFLSEITFVAIKNGMHQSKGFAFFSPGIFKFSPPNYSHVKNLHSTILSYFDDEDIKQLPRI